ncbi:MAG: class I SAM-dependent DNA methyltransferase [Spirochaeta sp.]
MSEKIPGSADPYTYFAEFYDIGWSAYAEYCRDVVLAAEESAARPFRRVCDAACGTGVLLELLRESWSDPDAAGKSSERTLLGFDISAEMLQRARERLLPEDSRMARVQLKMGDLRGSFPFHGPIDLVTCMHDSLNYLQDSDDLLQFFTRVRWVLAPDGVCICDINTPKLYRMAAGKAQDYLLNGKQIHETLEYREQENLGITRITFPPGTEVHVQRAYTTEEVEELLFRAGLFLSDEIEVEDESARAASGSSAGSGKVVYVAVKA